MTTPEAPLGSAPLGSAELATGASFPDVLCAIDGTEDGLAAVEHAGALAGPGGHLTLLVATSFRSEGERRSPAIVPTRAKAILDAAARIAEIAGVSCSEAADPASPPAKTILDWAHGRSLLAIGAPSTPWFGGMFLGGVTVAAESSLTTPLLVARASSEEPARGRRILVASDGLEGSDELVALAGRLARAQGAEAILLHAIGPESNTRPHRIEEQSRRLQLATGGAGETCVEAGSPRAVILETARSVGASLIVMSSRRLRGVRAIGSVSRRVVHHAHCTVLLVPPEALLTTT